MKIIDLLNKIANGEDVPNKIKYRKCIFEYKNKFKDYFTIDCGIPASFETDGIFRNIFSSYNNCLNDEVEIIEEYKEIEKLNTDRIFKRKYLCDDISIDFLKADIMGLSDKINELIDKVNSLEKRDN